MYALGQIFSFFSLKKLNFVRAFHLYVMKLTCIQKNLKIFGYPNKAGLKILKINELLSSVVWDETNYNMGIWVTRTSHGSDT